MLKCLVSGDWHLCGMQKVFQNPIPYQIAEIEKLYEYALSAGIKHIVVPGDLTHTPTMTDEAKLGLLSVLMKYDGLINTHYILGNHDVESLKKSSLDVLFFLTESELFKSFKVYKTAATVKLGGVHVVFMPFPCVELPKTKLPPLVFAHIEEEGAFGDNGRPLKTAKSDSHYYIERTKGDYLITGHLHTHQFIKAKRTLYPGTLYQTKFDEKLPKGFLEVEASYVDGRLVVDYAFIDNKPNFSLETVHIESASDWATLSTSKSIRYKILVAAGVVIPEGILQQFPNIVSLSGLSTINKVSTEKIICDSSGLPELKITTGLKRYLTEAGLEKPDVKRGVAIAKEAASILGL